MSTELISADPAVADPITTQRITDDLDRLLTVLPESVRRALEPAEAREQLLEVVLDLGRVPEARYPGRAVALGEAVVERADLEAVVQQLGAFGGDNRAGIERTLHRISAIRNRTGVVVGLTCRVGRAVFGTVAMVRDLMDSGQSLLLMGRPGVGKTTALREIARVLADELEKRVVVIDTSNEIAGDGDIPHPAIGRARRMQVARPELQHQVMIEAVENHMPEVIVIDEIGTELEAQAARTIAERGVMLVATAHGNELANLVKNPTLSDLVGGIESVTLGDEEARRRRAQDAGVPILVIKADTLPQIQRGLERLLQRQGANRAAGSEAPADAHDAEGTDHQTSATDDALAALEECRLAVEQLVLPQGQPVELLPRSEAVRQMQADLAARYQLESAVFGSGRQQRLRIFPR